MEAHFTIFTNNIFWYEFYTYVSKDIFWTDRLNKICFVHSAPLIFFNLKCCSYIFHSHIYMYGNSKSAASECNIHNNSYFHNGFKFFKELLWGSCILVRFIVQNLTLYKIGYLCTAAHNLKYSLILMMKEVWWQQL